MRRVVFRLAVAALSVTAAMCSGGSKSNDTGGPGQDAGSVVSDAGVDAGGVGQYCSSSLPCPAGLGCYGLPGATGGECSTACTTTCAHGTCDHNIANGACYIQCKSDADCPGGDLCLEIAVDPVDAVCLPDCRSHAGVCGTNTHCSTIYGACDSTGLQGFGRPCNSAVGWCSSAFTCSTFLGGFCTASCGSTAPCPASPSGAICTGGAQAHCVWPCVGLRDTSCPSGLGCRATPGGYQCDFPAGLGELCSANDYSRPCQIDLGCYGYAGATDGWCASSCTSGCARGSCYTPWGECVLSCGSSNDCAVGDVCTRFADGRFCLPDCTLDSNFCGSSLHCSQMFATCETTGSQVFGQRCGGSFGSCSAATTCLSFNGGSAGYCTATCGASNPCPNSPPGAACVQDPGGPAKFCIFPCTGPSDTSCPQGFSCLPSASPTTFYCTAVADGGTGVGGSDGGVVPDAGTDGGVVPDAGTDAGQTACAVPDGGPTSVRAGSLVAGTELRYQYSPIDAGTGSLLANWDAVPGATGYRLQIGATPCGSDILAAADVGNVTSHTAASLTLAGAWTGKTYYVAVAATGVAGASLRSSNGVQVAEGQSWDGISTAAVRNDASAGYGTDFPPGGGFTVFYGNHYFETVNIAAGTIVHLQPFGKADSVPAGVVGSDARVTAPKDGWLGVFANSILVAGTIDAAGRGYGGAGGAGLNNSSTGGGSAGSNGLSGSGGAPGGAGSGAAGGGGSNGGGVAGGSGGIRGGAGGGATYTQAGGNGTISGGGSGGGGSCTPPPLPGAGGTNPFGGGGGGRGSTCGNDRQDDAAGGGGAGYGAGGGGGVFQGSGGGGGGTGGGSGNGSHGLGAGGGASATAIQQGGKAGGYGVAGGNNDTSVDRTLLLGGGGGGGGMLGPGCGSSGCEGGGGGGAGGGAIYLVAWGPLSVAASAQLLTVGAAGGGGVGEDIRGGSGGGAGGGGGGILAAGRAIDLAAGATVDARGGTDGAGGGVISSVGAGGKGGDGAAQSANGGTLKLFYDTFTGAKPSTSMVGRLFDAGARSFVKASFGEASELQPDSDALVLPTQLNSAMPSPRAVR